jgi:hypothetical protein
MNLERCRRGELNRDNLAKEEILRYMLEKMEEQIDIYWRQRAHVRWLEKGDQNTSFFHAACSERRRSNKIGRLKKDDGGWVEEEEKRTFITNYFYTLFRSNGVVDTQQLTQAVECKVTSEMNAILMRAYNAEEVKSALDSIGDMKAPGTARMPSIFYKRFWEVVGEKVMEEVLQVLNGGPIPAGWNETTIVLIPKVPKPDKIKDLRPINLCNVLYKIVSKVLANRLKKVLPDIISPSQSAFVPGRLISDNILVAYEITHYMRKKRKGKGGFAAVKLDMSKAYDRVEWPFLHDMMLNLGFCPDWMNIIMKCVPSVSYRIKVNGELPDPFTPERGLRQGDPLSPYLFLICAEGFSALIEKAEREGKLRGIKV